MQEPNERNKVVNQDVPDNMSDMLDTGSLTQKEDGQFSPYNPEVNDMENNVSDNNNDIIDDCVLADELYARENNEVHVEPVFVNKYDDVPSKNKKSSNKSKKKTEKKKVVLKDKRTPSKTDTTFAKTKMTPMKKEDTD